MNFGIGGDLQYDPNADHANQVSTRCVFTVW